MIPLLAASVQQAASAFAFIEGVFAAAPNLKDLVDGATSDTLSLGRELIFRLGRRRSARSGASRLLRRLPTKSPTGAATTVQIQTRRS